MPLVLSFIPKVLLFSLTVCLLVLIVGPVILTVFFLILPAGDGGVKGERIRGLLLGRCFFLFSWPVGGVFSYSPISGAGAREGGHGGADLGLAIGTVFFFILLARGRCFLGRGQQGDGERSGPLSPGGVFSCSPISGAGAREGCFFLF